MTLRELNRTLLLRQMLLERKRISVSKAVANAPPKVPPISVHAFAKSILPPSATGMLCITSA